MSQEPFFTYQPDGVTFVSKAATKIRTIYAPLCGTDATGIKSSITPFLSGDIKIDKFRYITKPVSTEDLRHDLRNFFAYVEGRGIFSLNKETSPDSGQVEVGQLWQKLTRKHDSIGLTMEALNFVPVTGENVEVFQVTLKNTSENPITVTPTGCVPLFCRALDNKHDHEHVTSLLNRIKQVDNGVVVTPTMRFDEKGHNTCDDTYFVLAADLDGGAPAGTFPTTDSFYGDGGRVSAPQAVLLNHHPNKLERAQLDGKEAVGAIRFKDLELMPGDERSFVMLIGQANSSDEAGDILKRFDTKDKLEDSLRKVQEYWEEKSGSIMVLTGEADFNSWMRWVTIQPVLRRIYGCSFLPDHDYGKGGRGWRDLWQDLLSLILIEPEEVRDNLINNFAGVRIDGSNATIIGEKPGEFVADRNAISRVWMDHGAWPLSTTLLYIHQTGDFDILLEEQTYFRDPQLSRAHKKDDSWSAAEGNILKSAGGGEYRGTIFEHLLIQNLTQFFNVGEHNILRLEGADWNDGLDMAADKGESVAFSSYFAGNLLELADLAEELEKRKGIRTVMLAEEILDLLDSAGSQACNYDSVEEKTKLLYNTYFEAVQPSPSGKKTEVNVSVLAVDLRKKAHWLMDHLRKQEIITVGDNTWFNGYYDNTGTRVEGERGGKVRMTLTGQVFPLMNGLADKNEAKQVIESVNTYLRDKEFNGIRLNSDFGVEHYLDLGRAFGFAFGTKENGAFFSHMTVMYAFALYKQGFAREAYDVLHTIFTMSTDRSRAKIFPGIPEYIDSTGKGMYHYLTGSASWYVLTVLTQMFGVRGYYGDLLVEPKLVKEQFDTNGIAAVACYFSGTRLEVDFENVSKLDYGEYSVKEIFMENKPLEFTALENGSAIIHRDKLSSDASELGIKVILG